MHRVQLFTYAAGMAIVFTAATAGAQTPQTPSPKPTMTQPQTKAPASSSLSGDDQTFAQKAAEGGMKEVNEGKMVASKASNAQVKAFANRLVRDHSASNTQLKALAKRKNITLPGDTQALSGKDEPWMSQTGAEFDKAFIDAAVKDHEADIAMFEKEANSGSDADLKAFAKKSLPTLRAHLKQAQDLQSKLGTTK